MRRTTLSFRSVLSCLRPLFDLQPLQVHPVQAALCYDSLAAAADENEEAVCKTVPSLLVSPPSPFSLLLWARYRVLMMPVISDGSGLWTSPGGVLLKLFTKDEGEDQNILYL